MSMGVRMWSALPLLLAIAAQGASSGISAARAEPRACAHCKPPAVCARHAAGYTPYDLIDFSDIPLKHEVVAKVDRPIGWGAGWAASGTTVVLPWWPGV